jgi:hypothetical protein
VENCEAPRGGAIYLFILANDPSRGILFWICDLALFVFGDMPDRIYVQQLRYKEKAAFPPAAGVSVTQQVSSRVQPTTFTH